MGSLLTGDGLIKKLAFSSFSMSEKILHFSIDGIYFAPVRINPSMKDLS
jgi:hypothetical protein